MAGLFAETSTLIGFDGSQLNGRKEIYNVLNEIFTHFPTAAYITIVQEVRLMSDTSGMIRAVVGMIAEGQSDINPAVNAVQSMVATKQGDSWQIALFQNTPAAFHGRPEMAELMTNDLRAALLDSEVRNN